MVMVMVCGYSNFCYGFCSTCSANVDAAASSSMKDGGDRVWIVWVVEILTRITIYA